MGTPRSRGSGLRRFLAEGLVIVASILLAFGIDAWWDHRQEARAFLRTLEGLEAAFSENVVGIEGHLETIQGLGDLLARFLDSDPAELALLSEDSAHAVLVAVERQGTASLNNEYLTELVDAADLSGHPEIDAIVATWRREAFLVRERRSVLVDLGQQVLAEASRYDELSEHVRGVEGPHGDAAGLARFRENPDVVALARLKTQSWGLYARYFRNMLEASEALVEALREARTS